jgi:hypothetical protein
MPKVGKSCAGHESDIPRTNHCYAHKKHRQFSRGDYRAGRSHKYEPRKLAPPPISTRVSRCMVCHPPQVRGTNNLKENRGSVK